MQSQGTLQEADLASLLQTLQGDRATGTLTLENGAESCALYFLFGHLFHASSPSAQGEPVVVSALGWHTGTFHFDPRAKLPAEETIRRSTEVILQEALASGAAQPAAAETAGVGAAPPSFDSFAPPPPTAFEAEAETAPAEAAFGVASSEVTEPVEPIESAPAPVAAAEPEDEPEPQPEPEAAPAPVPTYAAPAYTEPEPQPQAPPGLASWAAAQADEPAAYTAPAPAPAPAPQPAATGAVPIGGGAPSAAPLTDLFPLPSGKPSYEGLKSAFVDFPRLLRTLRSDNHTGYVRLEGGGFSGILLMESGQLLNAMAGAGGGPSQGEEAFAAFRRAMDAGDGILDVIELSGDTVSAVAQVLTAPPLYTGLLGRFINFPALLEYLAEEQVDGSVIVQGDSDMGVILLQGGAVLGAYTKGSRSLQASPDAVAKLATERPARIEVKGGGGSAAVIDVDAALARPV